MYSQRNYVEPPVRRVPVEVVQPARRLPARKATTPRPAGVSSLAVLCIKPRCGDPIPLSRTLRKREMTFVGVNWMGEACYLCCECGGRRRFAEGMDGTIWETTRHGWLARFMRGVFSG